MSTAEIATRYTPEDLLTMPDGNRYELVDGQLVEKNKSFWSSYVGGRVYLRLANFVDEAKSGWVAPEGTSFQCFQDSPNKVRRPDASFISLERFSEEQAIEEGHATVVPDLVVEVVSPNDSYYDVDAKATEYLKAGVCVVWVINPRERTARIHRAVGETRVYESDDLTAEEVLPGFRVRLGDLFKSPARKP